MLDTSLHRRLRRKELRDPAFRSEYQRIRQEILQTDSVIQELDRLRIKAGCSKAELARRIGKNPAAIRRLFTAEANPELRTIAAIASALEAEIRIVSRQEDGTAAA